uniref:ANT-5 n=1 Tax=Toxocara canis TaxID=6265 RepID=B5A258_TOXCA|nr:ANT-5 [Toxocara canis]
MVGIQMRGYSSIGDYVDNADWKNDEAIWMKNLRQGLPTCGVYNAVGKKERKKQAGEPKASRLIWFLPAIGRICEQRIFGGLSKILKELPFSVCGMPLFDYGERLKELSEGRGYYVCDDIAAWDTRISVGDLRMECQFLKMLADDPGLKNDIELMYRLYAHKVVMLPREIGGTEETALVRIRGQRGSGENVTYSMNTITNFCFLMAKYLKSKEVPLNQVRENVIQYLNGDSAVAMMVSGDDSVVILNKEESKAFSKAFWFNNETGKIRKDVAENLPSVVEEDIENVSFCSNFYVSTKFGGSVRMMPIRSVEEVLSKASLMLGYARDFTTSEAWARAQGFMMVCCYPHVAEIRLLGLALLSATRANIVLEGLLKPGRVQKEPWLGKATLEEAFRHCYGVSSRYPINVGLDDVQVLHLSRYNIQGGCARHRWKTTLRMYAQAIRRWIHQRYQDRTICEFEDCLSNEVDWNRWEAGVTEVPSIGLLESSFARA